MTFEPLTADRGAAVLTSYLAAFPVRTSASQEKVPELTGNDLDCGAKWRESLARYDHGSHSWKTAQPSLLEGWGECSVIWPRWGMMRDGVCWEHTTSARPTSGTASGLWPTPTVCGNYNQKGASKTSGDGLATAVKKWPTPTVHSAKELSYPAEYNRRTPGLGSVVLKPYLWPTPTVDAATERTTRYAQGGTSLLLAVRMWPTPQASDCRNRGSADTPAIARRIEAGKQITLTMTVTGGQLNPPWVEWLMGWPLGWTDCEPLEMAKFQAWRRSLGDF
jgi:hypothetical protein